MFIYKCLLEQCLQLSDDAVEVLHKIYTHLLRLLSRAKQYVGLYCFLA